MLATMTTTTNINLRSITFAMYLTIAASLALAVPVPAQTESATGEKKTTEKEIKPIPLSQIGPKAEDTAALLRAIRDRPVPDPEVERISKELPVELERLEDWIQDTDLRLAHVISRRNLDDLERKWSRVRREAEQWRDRLERRAEALDRDLETLQTNRKVWEVTLQAAIDGDMTDTFINLVRKTLADVKKEEARLGERRAELSTLESQFNRAEDLIDSAFDRLAKAKAELQARLYAFDSPTLWSILIHPPPRAVHGQQIRGAIRSNIPELGLFMEMYQDWLIVLTLFFVCFAVFLAVLYRRVKQLDLDDPSIVHSTRVLSRPVSASLVLSMLGLYVFFPDAPRILVEVTTIVMFVPLYRILPQKLVTRGRGFLAWLVVLYVLARGADVLPFEALLRRLLILLATALALLLILRHIRDAKLKQYFEENVWRRPLTRLEKTAAALLAIGLVANVLGNVTLAAVILVAVVSSAYLGLALYALFVMFDSVLRIGMGTQLARKLRMVRRHEDLVRRRVLTIARIGFVILWAAYSLQFLQILPIVVGFLRRVLTARAQFGEVGISLGGVLAFAVTVWVAFALSRLIRFVLDEDVFPRLTLPRGVPNAVSTGLHYVILLIGFFLAVAATGADLSRFTLLAGAFGVGIGFGLQNIVNNFISGLILITERPIMPGDTIEFGTMVGDVKRIGLRSSTIRTWEGAEVIVPNGNLISNEVTNWTLSDRQRRIEIPVGVAYGSNTAKVTEILKSVASQQEDVLENPAPYVLFTGFGDSSLDFVLRFWTGRFEGHFRVRSATTYAIEAAFKEAGITIPFPQRDLHVKSDATRGGDSLRSEGEPERAVAETQGGGGPLKAEPTDDLDASSGDDGD